MKHFDLSFSLLKYFHLKFIVWYFLLNSTPVWTFWMERIWINVCWLVSVFLTWLGPGSTLILSGLKLESYWSGSWALTNSRRTEQASRDTREWETHVQVICRRISWSQHPYWDWLSAGSHQPPTLSLDNVGGENCPVCRTYYTQCTLSCLLVLTMLVPRAASPRLVPPAILISQLFSTPPVILALIGPAPSLPALSTNQMAALFLTTGDSEGQVSNRK